MSKRKMKDLFSLDRTLRILARWLVEHEGLPKGYGGPAPLGGGRDAVGEPEHVFLMALAATHANRHSVALPTPECAMNDGRCRALGVARAIIVGCDVLRDRRQVKHVERLRTALWAASTAMKPFEGELREYLLACKQLHRTRWKDLLPEA